MDEMGDTRQRRRQQQHARRTRLWLLQLYLLPTWLQLQMQTNQDVRVHMHATVEGKQRWADAPVIHDLVDAHVHVPHVLDEHGRVQDGVGSMDMHDSLDDGVPHLKDDVLCNTGKYLWEAVFPDLHMMHDFYWYMKTNKCMNECINQSPK